MEKSLNLNPGDLNDVRAFSFYSGVRGCLIQFDVLFYSETLQLL